MKQPFFSIIIPCYNYGHSLGRAIESILQQNFVAIEIIVIDDGSTDNTKEVAKKFAVNNQSIHYHLQPNSGPATARNNGIKKAQGDYLILLDADDALADNVLLPIYETLIANTNTECLIGGHISVYPNGKTKQIAAPQLPKTGEQRFIALLDKQVSVCNGAMVIKRQVFDHLHFPEELRSCEDIPVYAHILLKFRCQTTTLEIACIYKHADSLRHNHAAALKYRLLAVNETFNSDIPEKLIPFKNKYLAIAHLSLFRTLYRANRFPEAQSHYKTALKLYPLHLFRWSYLFKYVKSHFSSTPLCLETIFPSKGLSRTMNKIERKLRTFIYRNYFKRDQFKTYNRLGLKLLLNYTNHIDRHLIIKQPYEMEQLAHFQTNLQSNQFDLFLDIGANIGLYSLIAANSGKVKKILSFEPDQRNNYQFKGNIAINRFINAITVFDYGLSDQNATVSFLQQNGNSTGQSRVEETSPTATNTSRYENTEIKVAKFDNEFNFSKQHAFVKIDVEGHELHTLEGMKHFLLKNNCTLQIEVFDENLTQVESLLSKLNYKKKCEFGEDRIFHKSN